MQHRSSSALTMAILTAAIAFSPSSAFAQDEAPRPPIAIGAFELWPAITIRSIGVDANVYNEAENPKRDFTATFVPSLQVVVKPPRTHVSVTTASDFVYFRTYTDQRHINRRFSASGEFDLTYIRPFASIDASDTEERPNAEIDERARVRDRRYAAGLRVPLGPLATFSIAARRGTNRYDEGEEFRGVELASELNSERRAIDGTFGLEITPLTTVGLAVSVEEDRFDRSPLRHSDSVRVTPTIAFAPAGYFSGSASVGWRRFDALDPEVADYSGLTAAGTVGVVISERYHLQTEFGRDVRYSYDAATPTYVWTSGRGTLRTELFGGFDVKIMGGREVMEYRDLGGDSTAGRDTLVNYGVGIGYNIRENVRVGVDADFLERQSADAPRRYTNNRVFGTLVWGVRQQ
jgi:hypothetical protein